jgi:Mn2+/Fe2+ NRAMP family transporter
LVNEKQWTPKDLPTEHLDSANSMVLTFLLSFSIMVCAAATLHVKGIRVESAIDMVQTLSPLGAWTATLFVLGIVAAGFSSIIPNFLLFPWLLCDYWGSKRDLKSPLLRTFVFCIAISGLLVIILGGKPVFLLILSQALSPLSMPIIITLLLWLLNKPQVVGPHKNSLVMNLGLVATLIFSLFMSFTSFYSLLNFNF